MLRNYSLLIAILFITGFITAGFAQDKTKFKNVLLNGKPAILNTVTGEITLVEDNTRDDSLNLKQIPKPTVVKDSIPIGMHIVQKGETLLDISNQYKVPLNTLKQLNNLETTIVNEGQRLKVSSIDTFDKENQQDESNSKVSAPDFHVVQKGETLYSISNQYNLTVAELKHLNNLQSDLVKIGQRLKVRNLNNEPDNSDFDSVIVKSGDTLYSIAKKYGISVKTLKQLNNLVDNQIVIGQKLRLK
jgi:LysM repeat protein